MPVIREYRTKLDPAGPVAATRRASIEDSGGLTASGIGAIGQGIQSFGEALQRRDEQADITDSGEALSAVHAKFSNRYNEEIQKGTLNSEKLLEDFDNEVGRVEEGTRTFKGSETVKRASTELRRHFIEATFSGQAMLAGEKAKTSYVNTLNNYSSTLINDPSSFEVARTMHEDQINQLVLSQGLPAETAEKLKRAGVVELAKSAVRGWIQLDPENAKAQLKEGKWDGFVGGDEKYQLYKEAEQGIHAREVDAERKRREQERLLQKEREVTQNKFLSKVVDGSLDFKDILNSNLEAFGSGSKDQFIRMIDENSKGGKIKTDPAIFTELFRRIHLPDGDPKKIVDENELNQFVINRKLGFDDLNHLRGEVQGKRTQQGDLESGMKRRMYQQAEALLVKTNPMLGIKDPVGEEQYLRFYQLAEQTIAEERKKGTSMVELLSPDSPKYVGNLMKGFVKTPKQVMEENIRRMKPETGLQDSLNQPANTKATPPGGGRKPGESAADYLKRMSGG